MAVDATLMLGEPLIQDTVASLEVSLAFSATASEELAFFSIDVEPSSPALVGGGVDYSAFSFTPRSPLLDDWNQIGFFNDAGFESTIEFDDALIASLPAGTYTLGTLHVQFAGTDVPLGSPFLVSVTGTGTVIGTEDPTNGFTFQPVQFDPGSRTVEPVSVSGAAEVDEGATYNLTIDTTLTSDVEFLIDWGDGQQQTVAAADLDVSGQVPHVFADGDRNSTIHVNVQPAGGSPVALGEVTVAINNVAPTIQLTGTDRVDEGASYVLTLGTVIDPGDDTVTRYVIDWGDGNTDTIEAADLPAGREATHSYADGESTHAIVVDLLDEDGRHSAAGMRNVIVDNVAPTITLSGPASVDEGSVYTLELGSIVDPGEDTVTQYSIDWGDGVQETIDALDLPANREVSHPYTEGENSLTIVVGLVDEDGQHQAAGMRNVIVNNIAPVASLAGPNRVEEGSVYTLSVGGVVDPGLDTVTQYIVDWGDGAEDTITAAELPASRELTHTYADGMTTPTIQLDLVDEDGRHAAAGTLQLTVDDVSPTVVLSGPAGVAEGAPFTLSIDAVSDPGMDTVTQYIIDWGDGTEDTVNDLDLPPSREVTHTYLDGDATQTIIVSLVDEDARHESAGTLTVVVENVPPTATLAGPNSVMEGSPYTLTIGSPTDPGDDTVTRYIVDWGDGQQDVIEAASLPASRAVSHNFSDGPATVEVTLSLVDEDGTHADIDTHAVVVDNVPPTLTLDGSDVTSLGAEYELTLGPVIDPGDDTVTEYIIDWGDGVEEVVAANDLPPERTLSHTYSIEPTTIVIRVRLGDEDGTHLIPSSQTVDIVEGATEIERFEVSAATPGETDPDEIVTAVAIFSAEGGTENHTAIIDWGDGSPPEDVVIVSENGKGRVDAAHQYPEAGVYQVELKLTDRAGNMVLAQTQAFLTGSRLDRDTLQIVGSEGNDIITVTPSGESHLFVNVTLPEHGNERRRFDLAQVTGIDIYVGAGNDRVMVSDRLSIPTYMEGGPDHDRLQGGDGPNILLGGEGNDQILGGDDHDLLFGGDGIDLLLGYAGDDVLAGGDWQDPATQRDDIVEIWQADAPLSERQDAIIELLTATTDEAKDTLIGGTGRNLYLASEPDTVEDQNTHESLSFNQAHDRGWVTPHATEAGLFLLAFPLEIQVQADSVAAGVESLLAEAESVDRPTSPWTNPLNPLDVNLDGVVSPVDALIVINLLNQEVDETDTGQINMDASGDGQISPVDVLAIINSLNRPLDDSAPPCRESESTESITLDVPPDNVGSVPARLLCQSVTISQTLADPRKTTGLWSEKSDLSE